MATAKERADQRREEKLAEMQRQLDNGTLKVRKMTPAERQEFPARPEAGRKRRR